MKKKIFIAILFLVLFNKVPFAQKYMLYEVYNNTDVGFGTNDKTSFDLNFICTGPLTDNRGNPVGGYIDNYYQKQKWILPRYGGGNFSVRNGIFGVTKDGMPILVRYNDFYKKSYNLKWAFQNGPILVFNGINKSGTSTSKNYRSGIGFKANGNIIVIITKDVVTFKEFSDLFIKNGCTNAIYLDGYPNINGYVGYCFGAGTNEQRLGLYFKNVIKLQFFHQGKTIKK